MYKYEKIELDKDLPMKLLDVYIEKNTPNLPKHWHHSIEILVPVIGDLDVWLEGRHQLVQSGDIYIINSGDIHHVSSKQSEEVYKGYVIQINYDFLKSCCRDMDSIRFIQIKDAEKMLKVKEMIYGIIKSYNELNEYQGLKIRSQLLMLVYYLLSSQKVYRKRCVHIKSDRHRERIADIAKYIEKHYKDDLTVESIAEHFDISTGHLSRLFKEHLEVTVKDFITHIRFNHAYSDLIHTDYPIIEIALNHGFPNIKSFNTLFKKEYQDTPKHYRELVKK